MDTSDILSQAAAVRDETRERQNTALRVGRCLAAIAQALQGAATEAALAQVSAALEAVQDSLQSEHADGQEQWKNIGGNADGIKELDALGRWR